MTTETTITKAMGPPSECYSTDDVARMLGCSYRQLDYWCRTGLIPTQYGVKLGSGHRRCWTVTDIARARLVHLASRLTTSSIASVVELLENELALQRIETTVAELHGPLELEVGGEQ